MFFIQLPSKRQIRSHIVDKLLDRRMPILRTTVCACLCLWIFCLPAGATGIEPSEVVVRLQASQLSAMKNAEELGYQGRFEQLEPVVTSSHDLSFVARLAVGKYWMTFNDEQKARFVALFNKLSIATYADRFDGYAGEQFTLVSQKQLPRGKMLVETLFTKSNGEQLHFNYLLRQVDDHWRIINIMVDGISDLALKRAEYTSLVKKEGFSALIHKIEAQIARYANGQ